MTDDEIELQILRTYIVQHKTAEIAAPEQNNNCARELDMRAVLSETTRQSGAELDYEAGIWHGRLTREQPYQSSQAPLRACSDSRINNTQHRYHARAFTNGGEAPAWDRIRELEARQPARGRVERELEQKFRILYSPAQEQRDFDMWTSEANGLQDYSVAALFLDVDDFKRFNTAFTESVIDRTLLPELQRLVRGLTLHRGAGYGHGGDELLVLLPNCPLEDAEAFAEKMSNQIAAHTFLVEEERVHLTVSVGVAAWPLHGTTLVAVIERSNREERSAKKQGQNRVRTATAGRRIPTAGKTKNISKKKTG